MITAAAVGKADSLHLRKYNWEKPQKLVPTPKNPKREKINNNAVFCSMGSVQPKKASQVFCNFSGHACFFLRWYRTSHLSRRSLKWHLEVNCSLIIKLTTRIKLVQGADTYALQYFFKTSISCGFAACVYIESKGNSKQDATQLYSQWQCSHSKKGKSQTLFLQNLCEFKVCCTNIS